MLADSLSFTKNTYIHPDMQWQESRIAACFSGNSFSANTGQAGQARLLISA